MEPTKFSNPFRPDFGDTPPYLAGREDAQSLFRENITEMSNGQSGRTTVLYGPRGMGKTALLGWFQDEVEKSEAKKNSIRVVWVTPNELNSPLDLCNSLLPPPSWIKERLGKLKSANAGVELQGVKATAAIELTESMARGFAQTLIEKNKKRPLILLMDEAHNMNSGLCNDLLNVYQKVRKEMPFMLVLAGTPRLRHFLSGVNATFVERSRKIGLGRLDEQSAADAISKPFEEQGMQITDDALSLVVEDSQCYPYFLQEWGKSLWMEANKENLTRLSDEQVAVVKPNITIIKKDFYNDRRDKLKTFRLQSTAVAIAQAFQDTKAMTDDAIMKIITDNLSVDTLNTQSDIERLQTFVNQDFIWRPQGSDFYEPGIPSFMTHILDQQPSQD